MGEMAGQEDRAPPRLARFLIVAAQQVAHVGRGQVAALAHGEARARERVGGIERIIGGRNVRPVAVILVGDHQRRILRGGGRRQAGGKDECEPSHQGPPSQAATA